MTPDATEHDSDRDGAGQFTSAVDAPTADVADEEVEAFLSELNRRLHEEHPSSASGFSTGPLHRDTAEQRRTAIDPASRSGILPSSHLKIIEQFEALVESGHLVAAAALRRRDGLNVQSELAGRLDEYAAVIEENGPE